PIANTPVTYLPMATDELLVLPSPSPRPRTGQPGRRELRILTPYQSPCTLQNGAATPTDDR
ncbi:MAG: hypothetical protein LC749_22830, partial [Actinobacteria bacterium]|nr:hypothetical protein [Actinomycetota bacterium]